MDTVAVGIFQYVDYNGRWYVGAEWHHDTDTDTPTRIIQPAQTTSMDTIESLFATDGYDNETSAIEAIQACTF